MEQLDHLRPLERRVERLAAAGEGPDAIGRRFKRSSDHIERVRELANLPGRRARGERHGLRPLERRLLQWRDRGASVDELADRFRRGADHIERILELADYKQRRLET